MWMENGKNNKIKEQFKAEMSTTDHTLLPGSPAVHLVSLCLICGHLWCALSRSSHLVHLLRVQTTICAPFLLTQGARPLALPAAGRRCRQAASQSPPQASTNYQPRGGPRARFFWGVISVIGLPEIW